jgi:uncharacterized spore protein YtfJ
MKKFIAVVLITGLVFGMAVSALAQESIEQSTKFIEVLVPKLQTLLKADNVLGTPIEYEGMKIIPIVGYGFGFGGGSGTGGGDQGRGTGTGVGAGGGVMPISFLVITKDGKIDVIGAKKGVLSEIVKAVVPAVIEAIKAKQAQQQEKPETPPAGEAEQPK